MEFDDIIVGAGSSGAVIAARLSEDANRKVLLVEAGPDYHNLTQTPEDILAAHQAVLQGHNWAYQAVVREPNLTASMNDAYQFFSATDNRTRLSVAKAALKSSLKGDALLTRFDYPLGRVVGGSSAVNGCLALQGAPEDYDEWALAGNPYWSWQNVKQRFDAMVGAQTTSESDCPIVLKKTDFDRLHPAQRCFYDVCQSMGYTGAELDDPVSSGVGILPRNVADNIRISSSIAYLSAARNRPNLTILSDTLVNRVIMQGNKAVGIEAIVAGQFSRLLAEQVILSAGAINTPGLLMRSGIGASEQLRSLGITTQCHLPGVGENLSDHASVGVWFTPQPDVCQLGEDLHQVMLRYTSAASSERNDMQLYMINSVDTSQFPELKMALGTPLAMSITAVLGKPFSKGRVEITDNNPASSPSIYLNCASDKRDVNRLAEGIRLAWDIVKSSPMKEKIGRTFAWNDKIIQSDQLLRDSISTFVRGSWHPTGTAKMGMETDPLAVVNQYGEVHGLERLIVADASIMPTIPRVPTNLTCMMIGEQIAAHLKKESIAVAKPQEVKRQDETVIL